MGSVVKIVLMVRDKQEVIIVSLAVLQIVKHVQRLVVQNVSNHIIYHQLLVSLVVFLTV